MTQLKLKKGARCTKKNKMPSDRIYRIIRMFPVRSPDESGQTQSPAARLKYAFLSATAAASVRRMPYFQFLPETENAHTQNLSILSILSDNLLCRPEGMEFLFGRVGRTKARRPSAVKFIFSVCFVPVTKQ
jgi:hypothetical protein